MAEAFHIKERKGLDWLESTGLKGHEKWLEDAVTEWASDLVIDHFAVASIDELCRSELDEVVSQWQKLNQAASCFHPLALGLLNVIREWESEHGEEVI